MTNSIERNATERETAVAVCPMETPVSNEQLLEEVLNRENLERALKRVVSNKGSAGVDGMTVGELPAYLKEHWPKIREKLLCGTYVPKPVKRTEIPKGNGGTRNLGIPTVLDRFIQQALMQVLQARWDGTFSDASFGFRPGRSAHQAVEKAQEYVRGFCCYVVDIDLEKFFDRVNHDKLMSEVTKRVSDKRVLKLIRRYLEAGVMEGGVVSATSEGTPQGGPLSPLLSNLLLDELDRELERRGHHFVRYADDCNVYVRSRKAGERVMKSISRFIEKRLKLKVNQTKSAVAPSRGRKFLGFNFGTGKAPLRAVAEESVQRFRAKVRELTRRTQGRSIEVVVSRLAKYLRGWVGYFGFAEIRTIFQELDSWIHRRLRSLLWKQWGRRGRYKELRRRGVSQNLAWSLVKSCHGPWRLARTKAINIALPNIFFQQLGLPQLATARN